MASNVTIIRRGFKAAAAGDSAGMRDVFAKDAVWRILDGAREAQTHRGRAAILRYLSRFRNVKLEAIVPRGDDVVAFFTFTLGSSPVRESTTAVYRMEDGKCTDVSCQQWPTSVATTTRASAPKRR